MKRIAAVIFHRSLGTSYGERLVAEGRRAATLDLIEKIRCAGLNQILLVTEAKEAEFFKNNGIEAIRVPVGERFHFGAELKRVIREEDLDGILHFGGGSGLLFPDEGISHLSSFAAGDDPGALFNNFYSCDFAAISRAEEILGLELPQIDNPLGFALADAGIPCRTLERSLETDFDIDTPTDLVLLESTDRGGRRTREFLSSARITHPHLKETLRLLTERSARLTMIGRLNPGTWSRFERAVACRTSAIVEGRGMRSSPDGGAYLMNRIIRDDGIPAFFARLARSADGALIDTRPLLAENGQLPTPADRFASDLLRPEKVKDQLWREFTAAALDSPIPVILGGHSLMSGGLHLLAEGCWKGRDLPCRLHPESFDWKKERA